MKIRHPKKYYICGLISLIFLPILFFVTTIEVRKKAIYYGSIEVQCVDNSGIYDPGTPRHESSYAFIGNDETIMISNFKEFCQTKKEKSWNIIKVTLPDSCSYNFFVQVLDVLHTNKFVSFLDHKTIRFIYEPERNFRQEYEPVNATEEVRYVYSELARICSNIKDYFSDEPLFVNVDRIIKYTDLAPPPEYGQFYFPDNHRTKDEPKSKMYFQNIGLWFLPVILLWLFLLIISIRRNRKLLPNQALKLTE
jgi:hypothetical protein